MILDTTKLELGVYETPNQFSCLELYGFTS